MEKEDEKSFPSLDDIMKVRQKTATWCHLVLKFIKYIIPETREYILTRPFQEWCPISAEALLFVILENSYDLWVEEALQCDSEYSVNDLESHAKWTERKGTGRKFGGWCNDGIKRFNEIFDKIGKWRDNKKASLELQKKLEKGAKDLGMHKTKRKYNEIEDGERPRCDMPSHFEAH